MATRVLAVLALVAGASAFQVAPALRPGSLAKHALSLRPQQQVAAPSFHRAVTTSPQTVGPQTVVAAASDGTMTPRQMEEWIYSFNKIIIDTVYDIICFLYPVTGGKRDFARFYVLETVARVPYFAYLSVMHLRETFGERDPKLGERMRTHYAEVNPALCPRACHSASETDGRGVPGRQRAAPPAGHPRSLPARAIRHVRS